MAFDPGIIVTDPDTSEIAMVVEVKTDVRSLDTSERQLKRFMSAMGCPVGLLVTPRLLRLYHDQYTSLSEDSIALAGEFDVGNILHFEPAGKGRQDEFDLERVVQSWLESLATESGLRELPADLRRAALFYIVPAISQGSVRAGHPREPLIASQA
jgi:hypothetical protein